MFAELKRHYRIARLAWHFLTREEMSSTLPVPMLRRLAMLRRGYLSQADELFNLKDYKLEDYFSDWPKARMSMMYDNRNVRAGYQYGLNNKIFSTAILGQFLRVPMLYAIIEHGRLVGLHPKAKDLFAGSWQDACRLAGGSLVFKPSAGGRGIGVFVIVDKDGELIMDGVPVSEDVVQRKISGLNEYIVVEFLEQGNYAANLYPESTNTIRVVTIIDPDDGQPYLPIAVQRIGRSISKPVDNWNRSGLCAEVDLSTGKLGRAAARESSQRSLVWHDVHPDTGAQIRGAQVPNWGQIKNKILETAESMAYYKFLSWDVVVMNDGIAVIEADTVSGIETLQVHRPLLRDQRIRRFMQYHGYLA